MLGTVYLITLINVKIDFSKTNYVLYYKSPDVMAINGCVFQPQHEKVYKNFIIT